MTHYDDIKFSSMIVWIADKNKKSDRNSSSDSIVFFKLDSMILFDVDLLGSFYFIDLITEEFL